jgi:uncharacterized protein YcnI
VRRLAALVVAGLFVAGAAPAAAHVDVLPAEVAQGDPLEFTVRVPTERNLQTTQVRIDFPSQITVYSFATPPPGWTMRTVLGPDKRYSGVVYSDGRIPVGQYADFHMLGTPFESGSALWKVRQTYADGKVKPWTGPPEKPGEVTQESGPTAPGPAAVVTIAEPGQAVSGTAAARDEDDSGAAIWLGVIAIAISGLALLALGFLWSTRPARLPGGDEGS